MGTPRVLAMMSVILEARLQATLRKSLQKKTYRFLKSKVTFSLYL